MKNTETVKQDIYKLFHQFRCEQISAEILVSRLFKLCKATGKKSYWWRFFRNDTGANDANSVACSLTSPKNTKYLIECIDLSIETKELQVYCS